MDEDEREALQNIIGNMDKDVKMPPYNQDVKKHYSREYQEYKREDKEGAKKHWYERLCLKAGSLVQLKASREMRESLFPSIRLLDWEITPGMVLTASLMSGITSLVVWFLLLGVNAALGFPVPPEIGLMTIVVPIAIGFYIYYKPKLEAQNKVIKSSGGMIMSILYMVVYMRSSPNLEGAVRFAALNLEGPISDDLKKVLWDVEMGRFSTVSESLQNYSKIWKDFNDDYLSSLQLLEAAMNDPSADRREDMLQNAIDEILDGTRTRMKHYAQDLKTPVMILNALGAMLPVMGMIMLPIISVFLGASITASHLMSFYNLMLPGALYWFMERVLSSRPPTTSTSAVSKESLPKRNQIEISPMGFDLSFPSWVIGVIVFFIIALYGLTGYLAFPHTYPAGNSTIIAEAPQSYISEGPQGSDQLSPIPMLMRSVSITYALGIGVGISLLLGNRKRKKREQELEKIEKQFPEALFQLGNNVAGGTPIELALEDAADSTREMEISGLFEKASHNVRDLGMTFKDSLFDSTHGSLKRYPSKTIHTVMKAVLESSEKGARMASLTMMTISRYLENIQETQEQLNDLLEETTSTIVLLAYLLAPVVSGVAVGMSQTIISAMTQISSNFAQQNMQGTAAPGIGSTGFLENIQTAISPEILQFVVGIYLIQLLYILGTFYTKITKGEDVTHRNLMVGKLLLIGCTLYTIILVIVAVLFGGVIANIGAATA